MDSFQENKFTLGVIVDLSKALGTVNHEILLPKLSFFGIENTYLKSFKSYLHNRKQFVTYDNNEQSNLLLISYVVPQALYYVRCSSNFMSATCTMQQTFCRQLCFFCLLTIQIYSVLTEILNNYLKL